MSSKGNWKNGAGDLLGFYRANPAAVLGAEGSNYVKGEPIVHTLKPVPINDTHHLAKPLDVLSFEGVDVYDYPTGYRGIIEGGRKPIVIVYVHPNGSGGVTKVTGENVQEAEKNMLIELFYESRDSPKSVRKHLLRFIKPNKNPGELSDRL